MKVVECAGKADDGDHCGQFMKDEEGSYMGEGSVVESGERWPEKFGSSAEDSFDAAGLRWRWWWKWSCGCCSARGYGEEPITERLKSRTLVFSWDERPKHVVVQEE